uniref:Uncharacterized protein n=1 Tax=Rhizophora mucronata TaxID=61149 RepID=A0A2P2PVH3_RHIMU
MGNEIQAKYLNPPVPSVPSKVQNAVSCRTNVLQSQTSAKLSHIEWLKYHRHNTEEIS